jgi:hypothetical protein
MGPVMQTEGHELSTWGWQRLQGMRQIYKKKSAASLVCLFHIFSANELTFTSNSASTDTSMLPVKPTR